PETAISGSPFSSSLNSSYFLTVSPNGSFLYATNGGSTTVAAYSLSATTGVPTAVTGSPVSVGTNPQGLCVDSESKYLYVASGNYLYGYSLNASTGLPTALSTASFAEGTAPIT